MNKTLEGFYIKLDKGLSEADINKVVDAVRMIKGVAFSQIFGGPGEDNTQAVTAMLQHSAKEMSVDITKDITGRIVDDTYDQVTEEIKKYMMRHISRF